jgi:ABC-type phosphate transport system substrate-binding protein
MRTRVSALGILTTIAISFALVRDPKAQAGSALVEQRNRPSQSLAIVVNRSNPIDSLSFVELRKIFLGERNHWQNGHRIAIAMLDYGQPERRTVLHLIYHMDEKGYEDFLLRGMFRGDVFVAPKTLASPVVVRKFVFNAPGAIGYLRASDVDDSIKVIRIDGLLPEAKDYRLQIDEPSSSRGND